ncbi:uncharacterized protein FOMMEDRAFT_23099 [Fomitiporia mediterranea MF3/22]|uniref:uncharacterized protein n=1 Tax=Fomitiporia mediterranea (strain MF3/22) TaxID=694068 RepID=UPI0004409B2F|nr:uncharacterized protein FOMMEDRAFT_23099 [Fomitiporia mediterranea MF3/22]EJC99196.1 hypothetical protein FOMMEDRAFT_23099 [Fomitiporia mediterranea MF3/22]
MTSKEVRSTRRNQNARRARLHSFIRHPLLRGESDSQRSDSTQLRRRGWYRLRARARAYVRYVSRHVPPLIGVPSFEKEGNQVA